MKPPLDGECPTPLRLPRHYINAGAIDVTLRAAGGRRPRRPCKRGARVPERAGAIGMRT